jgi:hypothetical protein
MIEGRKPLGINNGRVMRPFQNDPTSFTPWLQRGEYAIS